jgi:hypothetical protein
VLWDTPDVALELETEENVATKLRDTDGLPDALDIGVTLCDRVSDADALDVCVGKTEELNVANDVEDKEMDSVEDEDLDVESDELAEEEDDTPRDLVREAVMAVVREGEAEAVALIEGVEAAVGERERLWLWLKVEDPDPDKVAIEDMVMELLSDMETLADEEGEGVLLGDTLEEEEVVADTSVVGERLWESEAIGEALVLKLEELVADAAPVADSLLL